MINEVKWFTVDIVSRILACALVGQFAWLSIRGHSVNGSSSGGEALLLGSIYMVWEYAQQAAGVVTSVTGHFQSFARQQADYASADIIRDSPAAHFDSNATEVFRWDAVELAHVTFRHPESRQAALTLSDVSFSLQRGKRYALIGASGSGKSTLLRILAGLYVAERIEIESSTLRSLDAEVVARALRSSSTLIPQDAEVFEGTLAENLALCESIEGPPARDEFPRALTLAQADEFIGSDINAGLDMSIAERGANWSGGQRSRVALARGVLAARGSSMLLLDEPTAALDPRTEAKVYQALFDAFPDACIVSSVHRLNLLNRFDEVLLMRDGKLLACGTEAELQSHSPEFQQLMAAFKKEGSD